MPDLFKCVNCNIKKRVEDFYPDRDREDKLSLFCIDCVGDIVGKPHKREQKKNCKTCFGYGMFKFDKTPLSLKATRAHYPSVPCPECGADWSKGKPSRYNPKSLSHLLVFWKEKQPVSSSD